MSLHSLKCLGTPLAAASLPAKIIRLCLVLKAFGLNCGPKTLTRHGLLNDRKRFMNQQPVGMLNTEYHGCGIQAASYKSGANDWVPEACFWLHTTHGRRRLWIASFDHCFGRSDLTFSRKIDADLWAFRVARKLIDRTLPEFRDLTEKTDVRQRNCITRVLKIVRRPFSAISGLKRSTIGN